MMDSRDIQVKSVRLCNCLRVAESKKSGVLGLLSRWWCCSLGKLGGDQDWVYEVRVNRAWIAHEKN